MVINIIKFSSDKIKKKTDEEMFQNVYFFRFLYWVSKEWKVKTDTLQVLTND